MNQPFNPYQHNVNVLRDFFRKPIILITAIAFCLPSIYMIFEPLLSLMLTPYYINSDNSISLSLSFDIVTVLFAISFFMLYFKSRSRKPFVKLNAAIMVARVTSIAFAILNALMTALLLVLGIILIVNNNVIPEDVFQTIIILVTVNLVNSIFVTLMYFAISKFTKSVRYSLTSVFITKKSSVFAFVASVLGCVTSAVATIIPYTMIVKLVDVVEFLISLIPPEYVQGDIERIKVSYYEILTDNISLVIIKIIVSMLPYLLLGITALMYYFYVKKITNNLVLTPTDNEATRSYSDSAPIHNNAPQTPVNQNNSAPFVPPVVPNYNPNFSQGVKQPSNAPVRPVANTYENPYAANNNAPQAPVQPMTPPQNFVPQPVVFGNNEKEDNKPAEKVCSSCGEKSPANMKFCPYCGNKF